MALIDGSCPMPHVPIAILAHSPLCLSSVLLHGRLPFDSVVSGLCVVGTALRWDIYIDKAVLTVYLTVDSLTVMCRVSCVEPLHRSPPH